MKCPEEDLGGEKENNSQEIRRRRRKRRRKKKKDRKKKDKGVRFPSAVRDILKFGNLHKSVWL